MNGATFKYCRLDKYVMVSATRLLSVDKDNDTDLFCNYDHKMLLCEVEHLESLYACSALNPSTN